MYMIAPIKGLPSSLFVGIIFENNGNVFEIKELYDGVVNNTLNMYLSYKLRWTEDGVRREREERSSYDMFLLQYFTPV